MNLTSKPRVLLAGATGRVGTAIRERLATEWELLPVSLGGGGGTQAVDLSSTDGRDAVLHMEFDAAVNAAAQASPAGCAADPACAWRMNATWPAALATRCRELGVPLVHFSTDLVYGGSTPPYTEVSPAVPRSWYGWTKLMGDNMVAARDPDALILRTSVVFGEIDCRRKTFSQEVMDGTASKVYVDCWRNHTPVHWLAGILPRVLETDASGLFIASSTYAQTRAAFAEALLRFVRFAGERPELAYAPPGTPSRLDMRPERLSVLLGAPCPSLDEAIGLEYGRRQ